MIIRALILKSKQGLTQSVKYHNTKSDASSWSRKMPRKFLQGIGESTDCIFFTRGRIRRPRYGVTWQFNEDVSFIVLSSEFVLLTYTTKVKELIKKWFPLSILKIVRRKM